MTRFPREGEYLPPEFRSESFYCSFCHVLAPQEWTQLGVIRDADTTTNFSPKPLWEVRCSNCRDASCWFDGLGGPRCVFPITGSGPRPKLRVNSSC
jgi:hypothetical protein